MDTAVKKTERSVHMFVLIHQSSCKQIIHLHVFSEINKFTRSQMAVLICKNIPTSFLMYKKNIQLGVT